MIYGTSKENQKWYESDTVKMIHFFKRITYQMRIIIQIGGNDKDYDESL